MSDSTAPDSEEILWAGSVSHWHYAGKWLFVVLFRSALVATFFIHLEISTMTSGDHDNHDG